MTCLLGGYVHVKAFDLHNREMIHFSEPPRHLEDSCGFAFVDLSWATFLRGHSRQQDICVQLGPLLMEYLFGPAGLFIALE